MKQGLSKKPILKFVALLVILAALYLFGSELDMSLEALRTRITQFPLLPGLLVFAALYAFVSVAPIPGRDVFKLLGAIVWGWWISTLFIFVGEILAALAGFVLARFLGKELIDRLFGERIQPYYTRLSKAGFQTVLFLRILPITPYRLFNFAAGITDLPLLPYLSGSAAGIFLRTLFFQFFFAFFGEQLIVHGITVGQLFIFSVLFTLAMVVVWYLLGRKKSSAKSSQ